MSNDFAFMFYPGDYLRDTQCLSEAVQVAYDRIMCEHMRNICISHAQLNFFTKRLSPEEKEELLLVLKEIEGGFEISWVADSIRKRKAYSDSRSKNRQGKVKKDISNTSKSYVPHMEDEDEYKDVSKKERKEGVGEKTLNDVVWPFGSPLFMDAWELWVKYRREQGRKPYKPIGLQGAFTELSHLSKGSEDVAIQIIYQAIKKNWTGFYELKNDYKNDEPKFTRERAEAAISQVFGNR